MTPDRRRRLISSAAFALGAVLFVITAYYFDFELALASGWRLGLAVACSLAASGLWHLARTLSWARCFAQPHPSVSRLARVRISAEAFSYLTVRGVAGEPLKVLLLAGETPPHEAAAAVALERASYTVGTLLLVGVGSVAALALLPLTPVWVHVFRWFAAIAGIAAALTIAVLLGKRRYVAAGLRRADRVFRMHMSEGRAGRFLEAVETHLLALVRGNPARLAVLSAWTLFAYACMCAEVWLILWAMGIPISVKGAIAVETFSRVAAFATAFIPANLGALEAASVAAAAAADLTGAGAPLALTRRIRGLFWAGFGLAVYPRRVAPLVRS
jgi:hypothetical protein